MLPALHFFEKLRDHGLFVFRVTVGGTMLFYSLAELMVGAVAWARIGELLRAPGGGSGAQLVGVAVLLFVLFGGTMLVLGLWTRWAALGLGAMVLGVAFVRWPEVRSGTLEGAAQFFYPLTLSAGLGCMATTGGGRFGLDGIYRARKKAKLRRRGGGR